ncbi:neprilysin-1-like [Dermacentor albipictus]|uniref:neprilysin-1-like n=1 Tax=Dermacentor albipictus TaxID=60249 RepID=UPI0031FCE97A
MSTLTTERRTTTTSTNVSTSTRPRPRSWLDMIEESPNRRKIEVGLISSICLVLLIVLSLTLFVVLTLQTSPVNKAPVNLQNAVFCENATCFEQARRVMGYVEWSREPCDDFYTYACKGYHVSVANSASKYPITQGAQEQLRAAVEEVLANWHANMKPTDNFYLRYGVNLFQECMQGVTDAKEQLQSVFADMTYNHKPFFLPKSFDLEPHTLASRVGRNFWFFPLITVRKDVDLENRQRMIVHLDEPELTAPRALFDDADFQREYMQAIRDLAINLGFENVNETGRIFKLEQMLSKGTTSSRARAPYYKKVKLGSLFLDKWNIYMYLSNVLGENMSPEDEVALRSEKYFSRFLKSLKTTEWGTVNNFIVFRLVQFLSPLLMPKESKILQFMYKYGHALRPPPSKRTRCLDIMEPYFKPLLLTAAKVTFKDTETKRAEASRAIANLKESFKRMSIRSFYPHTEQSTLNNKLRRMRIYYFYPYETKEYQYMKQWYRSWKKLQYKYGQIVKSFRNAGFEFAKSQAHKTIQDFEWKGSVFQQDPFYDADNNALYIPASLFEPPLYYGDSFLPFSIPMYGWRIGVKMFQAIDYRGRTITDSAQYRNWWGETLMARYNEVEKCFRNAHGSLKLADESELYDHIADSAVVIVLFREYKRVVQSRVGPDRDIRLRDIKQFSGDNLFFLSLAHGVCTRIFSDAAQVQKKGGKRIAQERLNMALTHWPMFKSLYECPSSAHMVPQRRCMFW